MPIFNRSLSSLVALVFAFSFGSKTSAQRITVNVDDAQQTFIGAGSSIPLYLFNHFQLDAAGQAEALELIVRDLNLTSLQDYPEFRPSDPSKADYFARRVEYLQAAKAIRPDLDLSMTFSIYPDDLRRDTVINGENVRRLDWRRPGIYGLVAEWYFDVLRFYHDRGLPIDMLNAVNEPDFITRRYGYGTNFQRGSAEVFAQAIDSLEVILANPVRNPSGVKRPLVMGPSTIGPGGAVTLINYYKNDRPDAWANIDIVSYHQYTAGTSAALQSVTRLAEGKPVYQSEMHTNRGDDLPALTELSVGHRGMLSLARTFGASVNAGANAWFYFLNVFPGANTNPGLLQIDETTTRPIPFRHYYAFKQLTSTQPDNSRLLTRQLASIRADGEVLCFRKPGSDTVYVHYANFTAGDRTVEFAFLDSNGQAKTAVSYSMLVSDATRNIVDLGPQSVSGGPVGGYVSTVGPYSINTYIVKLQGTSGLLDRDAQRVDFAAWRQGDKMMVRLGEGVEASMVRLSDIMGREMATWSSKSLTASGAAISFALDAPNLLPGVYTLSLAVNGQWSSEKLVW